MIWNRKPLPLPWLRAEDFVPDEMVLRERSLIRADRPGLAILDNTWSLAWYERVVRHLHVVADRRGVFRLDAVRLRVADLFARETAEEERSYPATYVVRPRTVPVRERLPARASLGERLAHDEPLPGPRAVRRRPAVPAGRSAPAGALAGHGADRADRRASGSTHRASASCCWRSTSRPSRDRTG